MVTLDYARYPAVIENICLLADWTSQLAFRSTSRQLLDFVDARLFERVSIDLSATSATNPFEHCAVMQHFGHGRTLPLLEFPHLDVRGPTDFPPQRLRNRVLAAPISTTLSTLTCGTVNLPTAALLPLPHNLVSRLSCMSVDSFDDSLPLLQRPSGTGMGRHGEDRAALTDRWERALRLARVIELRGQFDAAGLTFWSSGGRLKKLLGRRDVELVLDQRWGSGVCPLSADTWACWLNREGVPEGEREPLAPPAGACAIVANYEWRRDGEPCLDSIIQFLESEEVRRTACSGGDVTLVFHVVGDHMDLRPMPSAGRFLDSLAAYLYPRRQRRAFHDDDDDDFDFAPTLTLVGLEAMVDADVFALSLDVIEPPPRAPRRSMPTAMWCLLRCLEEHTGAWCPDRLLHLTLDEWMESAGRHAALLVDTAPFDSA